MSKQTQEEFIEKAKKVHSDFYDYSKVDYKKSNIPVTIICPIHGEFKKYPANHLSLKSGCQECTKEKMRKRFAYTKDKFIEESKKIHGDYYDYSKVCYYNSKTKVEIICPIHGSFWKTPDKHILDSAGCKQCLYDNGLHQIGRKSSGRNRLDTKKFIERAKVIHKDIYSYSLTNYKKSNISVSIICPIHGEFHQLPSNHLAGKGCKQCANEKHTGTYLESKFKRHPDMKTKDAILYLIKCLYDNNVFYKIGITTQKLNYRLHGIPFDIENIFIYKDTLYNCFTKEQEILTESDKFDCKQSFGGHTECITSFPSLDVPWEVYYK